MDTLSRLKSVVSGVIEKNVELAQHTSFRIGGQARYFYISNSSDEVIALISECRRADLSYFVLGGGSNILFSDKGFDGLVIKMSDNKLRVSGEKIECGAGIFLSKVVGQALDVSLSGLEWAIGIPGTIGGAVHNNAGAYDGDMASIVDEIEILRNDKIKKINKNNCNFSYRHSVFKEEDNNDIILSVTLNLKSGNKDEIKSRMDEIITRRKQKMDYYPSAGSVFRNPNLSKEDMDELIKKDLNIPEDYVKKGVVPAAWLIEECGLKGRKIGGAMISEKHAGRIINVSSAKASDVIMLISIIKQKVRSKFNIQLMEEIEFIGF